MSFVCPRWFTPLSHFCFTAFMRIVLNVIRYRNVLRAGEAEEEEQATAVGVERAAKGVTACKRPRDARLTAMC